MRRFGVIVTAILVGCTQIALHGLGLGAIVPNVMIITITLLLSRWDFADLALYAITLGVVLESASLAPVGTHIIACLLIVLIGKVVLRQAADTEAGQGGFLIVLGVCVTLAYNLVLILSMSIDVLRVSLSGLALRTAVETVYNVVGIAFGYYVLFAGRETTESYRLPKR